MAYVTLADIQNAFGRSVVLACFDDDNDGVADEAPVADVIRRACSHVDSYLSRAYKGTFPFVGDVPNEVQEAALYHAAARMYDRRPEVVRQMTEGSARINYRKLGDELLENLVGGKQAIVEAEPAKGPGITGGIVSTDAAPIFSGVGGDWG